MSDKNWKYPEYLTVLEFANLKQVSHVAVYKAIKEGRVKCILVGTTKIKFVHPNQKIGKHDKENN